jgi:hypothetical protein
VILHLSCLSYLVTYVSEHGVAPRVLGGRIAVRWCVVVTATRHPQQSCLYRQAALSNQCWLLALFV